MMQAAAPISTEESTSAKIKRLNSKEFPKRFMMSPSLQSPIKSPQPRKRVSGVTASNRIYKAPLALVRRESIHENPDKHTTELKSGATRRRRKPEYVKQGSQQMESGFTLERQSSEKSLNLELLDSLEPPIWGRETDAISPAQSAMTDSFRKRTQPRQRRPATHLHVSHGFDDSEAPLDEESFTGIYHSHSMVIEETPHVVICKRRFNAGHLLQMVTVFVLGWIIYDSNRKVAIHKEQLQQYDEERSHILEQMMWIDKAAKKVHKRYSGAGLPSDLEAESKEELTTDVQELRSEMEQLQLRIQLNARDRIHEKFGDNPMQVSLSLDAEGSRHVVIALSEDTPHAAGTWLQQIDKKMWDDVIFESKADYVQASTRIPNTSPLLEFVEKSKRCRTIGSVALRQLENMELHVLVLRINLKEDTPMDESDVCIGNVIGGLDELRTLQKGASLTKA